MSGQSFEKLDTQARDEVISLRANDRRVKDKLTEQLAKGGHNIPPLKSTEESIPLSGVEDQVQSQEEDAVSPNPYGLSKPLQDVKNIYRGDPNDYKEDE